MKFGPGDLVKYNIPDGAIVHVKYVADVIHKYYVVEKEGRDQVAQEDELELYKRGDCRPKPQDTL